LDSRVWGLRGVPLRFWGVGVWWGRANKADFRKSLILLSFICDPDNLSGFI
jgi:hypothetical protein